MPRGQRGGRSQGMRNEQTGLPTPVVVNAAETRGSRMVRVATSLDMAYYPPRWFSPLLSFVHFFIPWDRC